MKETLSVSVIVPTHNRAALLRGCLKSLLDQDYPADHYEVVVVNDGSSDETETIVKDLQENSQRPQVRLVSQSFRGINIARNRGIGEAKGESICFLDDDELAPPGWLSTLVSASSRHGESFAAFGGPYRTVIVGAPPRRVCGRCVKVYASVFSEIPSGELVTSDLPGGNLLLPRASFERYGLFDERLSMRGTVPGDDTEWFRRAARRGARFLLVTDAWVSHLRLGAQFRPRYLLARHLHFGFAAGKALRETGEPLRLLPETAQILRFFGHSARSRGCLVGLAHGLTATARLATYVLWRPRRHRGLLTAPPEG